MPEPETSVDAVIVGAGFAGLYQLYKFRALGLNSRMFDKAADVGGTWYWNRYPGARCDVESMWYSYSFSPELEQEWTWSEKYPTQPEVLRYLGHVADRFDLRRDITFDTTVVGATWDDQTRRWTVTTDGGDTVIAQYVVMATGCLSAPKEPEVPGIDRFRGRIYHTARWPWRTSKRSSTPRSSRPPTPGTTGRMCPASRRCSWPTSESGLIDGAVTRSRPMGTRDST
jgi:cation diffusion facilitator CzcD-associated flavoprotein CzcO